MKRVIEYLERKPPSFATCDVFGRPAISYDKKANVVSLSVVTSSPVLFWGTFLWRMNSRVPKSSHQMVSPFCVGPQERRVPIIDTAVIGWHGVEGGSAKLRATAADDLFRCLRCATEPMTATLSVTYDDEHLMVLEDGEPPERFSDSYIFLKIGLRCSQCNSAYEVWNEKM